LKFGAMGAGLIPQGICMFGSSFLAAACRFHKGIHENGYPLDNNRRRRNGAFLRWRLPGSYAGGDQLVHERTVYRPGGRVYPRLLELSHLDSEITGLCRRLKEISIMERTWPVFLLLLVMAAPAAVQAQLTFVTNADNTITITGYTGPPWAVTIPTNINGLRVVSIGDSAFEGLTNLTSVTMPGNVTSIGDYAFELCVDLTNVTIADGVTNIGWVAFGACYGLTSVTIPGSVISIGKDAFQYCDGLTNVTMVNGVTSIEYQAFEYCSDLTRVTIPGSVTNIGNDAFGFCSNLASVYFQGNAPTANWTVFFDDINATAYYLPGTSGWGDFSTNTEIPAVLWNPLIQAGDSSFGVRSNQFGFDITGTTNIPIVVEASANLASPVWIPLQTLALTNGLFHFSDPQWTNYPARFYRISSP
jgi:hypothetical protein